MDDDTIATVVDLVVLRRPPLSATSFQEHVCRRHVQCFPGRLGHQIQPVGVLGRITIVRALVFAQVQIVFVPIDDQRNLWDVAFIQAKARDATSGRPTAQVPGAFGESCRKQFRLMFCFLAELAKGCVSAGVNERFVGCLTFGGLIFDRFGPVELVVRALDPPVV